MICHRDTHKHISKKRYGSYFDKKFLNSLLLIPVRNYAIVLCNGFMSIFIFILDNVMFF